jgi:hypothetical protein
MMMLALPSYLIIGGLLVVMLIRETPDFVREYPPPVMACIGLMVVVAWPLMLAAALFLWASKSS